MKAENKIKFTQKIAKQLAQKQFNWTIGCLLGTDDPDYNLNNPIEEIEQEFEEDMEEIGINPTPKRVDAVKRHYQRMVDEIKSYLNKKVKKVEL